MATTSADDPALAGWRSDLSIGYQLRARRDADPSILDRAIALGNRAVAATSESHTGWASYVTNLVVAYRMRYEYRRQASDVEQAIMFGEDALERVPYDHPVSALFVMNLAIAYRALFEGERRVPDQQVLRRLAERAVAATTSPPLDRVNACWVMGALFLMVDDHATAVSMLETAISLLPSVAPRESGWADQERRLGQHRGLVSDAISAHCALGNPSRALEVAELGRGILLSVQLDLRSDVTELADAEPELARRYRHIRDRLNAPFNDALTPERVDMRRRWWSELDQLLGEIRRRPMFSRFLLPPRLVDLKPSIRQGTVILVSAGRACGDAIVIAPDSDPIHIALPALRLPDVEKRAATLLEASQSAKRAPGADVLLATLGWLWDTAVADILDRLDNPAASDRLPRVWWMPIGLLGLLPFHAAGHGGGQVGAMDRVVSSYTPTLRALAHAATRPAVTAREQLTVALLRTPGMADLPGTIAEAATLRSEYPGAPQLIDDSATVDSVLAALPAATWVHFACHATSDLASPSQGGLHLHDGTLPISRISTLDLRHAEFAYLSACSTADRGWQHVDECIHTASAFQLAGFRHVIASLWPLDDRTATRMARSFYGHLPPVPAAEAAALTLHKITQDLRFTRPDRPDLWASLIHSGPPPAALASSTASGLNRSP